MYSTKEVADLFNIHTNTIRFYEKMGYLSSVQRKENGYRLFTDRHVNQIHIIKLIYLKEWPGKHLRNESIPIIKALPEWNIRHIKELTAQYIISIKSEITLVKQAMAAVEKKNEIPDAGDDVINFTSAARKLGITKETLRNWERNGFFTSLRNSSNRKYINNQIFRRTQSNLLPEISRIEYVFYIYVFEES